MAQSDPGQLVSGNDVANFGIRPYAGRLVTADDSCAGAGPVVVMSYRLWQERLIPEP
jgi:hypothetical protein